MILAFKKEFESKILDGTKKHTIIEDKHHLWKSREPICMTAITTKYDFNQPEVFDFTRCTGTQNIEIVYDCSNNPDLNPNVFIDDKLIDTKEVYDLAINDGFDSINELFAWFNRDYSGKIIHWTDLRY